MFKFYFYIILFYVNTFKEAHASIAISWSDAFHNIRKKINLTIFTKLTIHVCIGVNIVIKKNYTRQRSHIIMAFLNNFVYKLYILTHFKV